MTEEIELIREEYQDAMEHKCSVELCFHHCALDPPDWEEDVGPLLEALDERDAAIRKLELEKMEQMNVLSRGFNLTTDQWMERAKMEWEQ